MRIIPGVTLLLVLACVSEPVSISQAVSADDPTPIAKQRTWTIIWSCSGRIMPECKKSSNPLSSKCKEGHDELYTAYRVNQLSQLDSAELVHYKCPLQVWSDDTGQWACKPLAQAISFVTPTWSSSPLCPGWTDMHLRSEVIADDDGCAIARKHGDKACSVALALGLADQFSWTRGSDIHLTATCSYSGCTTTGTYTNVVGPDAGANQLLDLSCTPMISSIEGAECGATVAAAPADEPPPVLERGAGRLEWSVAAGNHEEATTYCQGNPDAEGCLCP